MDISLLSTPFDYYYHFQNGLSQLVYLRFKQAASFLSTLICPNFHVSLSNIAFGLRVYDIPKVSIMKLRP